MWVIVLSRDSLDDTPPSDDVISPLVQVHLLGSVTGPLRFRSSRLGFGDALPAAFGRFLCKSRLRFLPLHTATEFALWFPPQPQQWGCSRGIEQPPERWEHPYAKHRGAYPKLRCVWPKRWQRLHCSGPFGATYDFFDTRKQKAYTNRSQSVNWGRRLARSTSRRPPVF